MSSPKERICLPSREDPETECSAATEDRNVIARIDRQANRLLEVPSGRQLRPVGVHAVRGFRVFSALHGGCRWRRTERSSGIATASLDRAARGRLESP